MNIEKLTLAGHGQTISIQSRILRVVDNVQVELKGGEVQHWLYCDSDFLLVVVPETEEISLYTRIEEELEIDDEQVSYGGDDYEFSYEDSGIESKEDPVPISFKDYESDKSERIRVLTNEDSGDVSYYEGMTLTEDDIISD
ncbi:TPA: hypothetical protein DCZ32_00165 [Candidatus Uhrbacteria bacterium]|nr:hypothetical protein [Candidatus Uhrbacteria bacterium]